MADNVFFKAIEAHTNWKIRLRRHLDGTSEEKLDPSMVCLDNQCVLGKWIYGEGQNHTDISTFEELRQTHADFHRCAAQVISKSDQGQEAEAEKIFGTTYSILSRSITKLLVSMNMAMRDRNLA